VLDELGQVLALHEHTRDRLLATVEVALGRDLATDHETLRWARGKPAAQPLGQRRIARPRRERHRSGAPPFQRADSTLCRRGQPGGWEQGLADLHLVAALTFGLRDPRPLGFDAAVEFPPHGEPANPCAVDGIEPGFSGAIFDFRAVVSRRLAQPTPPFRLYRTAMAGWDNTPRLGPRATVFHGASPGAYEEWLGGLVTAARLGHPEHRLVFVNAWNEWAEGAHLEPDERFGTGYLEATRRAVLSQ
jgi:hypothetical protein